MQFFILENVPGLFKRYKGAISFGQKIMEWLESHLPPGWALDTLAPGNARVDFNNGKLMFGPIGFHRHARLSTHHLIGIELGFRARQQLWPSECAGASILGRDCTFSSDDKSAEKNSFGTLPNPSMRGLVRHSLCHWAVP